MMQFYFIEFILKTFFFFLNMHVCDSLFVDRENRQSAKRLIIFIKMAKNY